MSLFYSSYSEDEVIRTKNIHQNSVSDVAVNDTFTLAVNTGFIELNGNVLANDKETFENGLRASLIEFPRTGTLVFKSNGWFTFRNFNSYMGEISFRYKVNLINNPNEFYEATVIIISGYDHDYDNILDMFDLDDDNDGIPDIHETISNDSDNDNVCNRLDIDSDNDGIPDNIEWQSENKYVKLSGVDVNKNGWDDAYDPAVGGEYYKLTDTDQDGIPDYLDLDSDNDRISDCTESYDFDGDKRADVVLCKSDYDFDGLDDSFDSVDGWANPNNSIGSKAVLADNNNNGIRDWRDDEEGFIKGYEDFFSTNPFRIYPNPSNGIFKINFNLKNEEILFNNIEIYDINGKLVLSKRNVGMNEEFNLTNLEKGVYLLRLKFDEETHIDRIAIY